METPFAIYDALSAIDVPPEKVRSVVQSLEHDMAMFATRSQFDRLDQFSGSRCELLRAEIRALAERFEQNDRRFQQADQCFPQIDRRFEHFDRRFDALEQRLVDMQSTIESRILLRVGAMLAASVALITTLSSLILKA